jgi:hypothetical protein
LLSKKKQEVAVQLAADVCYTIERSGGYSGVDAWVSILSTESTKVEFFAQTAKRLKGGAHPGIFSFL